MPCHYAVVQSPWCGCHHTSERLFHDIAISHVHGALYRRIERFGPLALRSSEAHDVNAQCESTGGEARVAACLPDHRPQRVGSTSCDVPAVVCGKYSHLADCLRAHEMSQCDDCSALPAGWRLFHETHEMTGEVCVSRENRLDEFRLVAASRGDGCDGCGRHVVVRALGGTHDVRHTRDGRSDEVCGVVIRAHEVRDVPQCDEFLVVV
mmetsp:Transcript_12439/g.33093  ORF Transcript_12439/g.33093 Transcript_12439/m.33093 type:complete len:208 (-) Transcript_12439:794-1417(-)